MDFHAKALQAWIKASSFHSSEAALHDHVIVKFPKLSPMRKSTLLVVGVDYQSHEYILQDGDEVSLFPPVQGG